MTKLRKILALVLVMAMTFTMLPVFAAADDAAVETVAPISEAPAVEDVAAIPETAPAEAPAVTAIETVAAETVAPVAELQALTNGSTEFADDAAAIAAGYFLKLTTKSNGTAYYNEFAAASTDISANNAAGNVLYLLCDYSYYDETSSQTGIISGSGGMSTLKNLVFDLGGHTLTVRAAKPVLSRGSGASSSGMNLRNGTLFYQNLGLTASYGVLYSAYGSPTQSDGKAMLTNTVTFTDVTCISLAPLNGGYAAPIFANTHWVNTLTITNSKLISVAGHAIEIKPANKMSNATVIATVKKATRTTAITLSGSCVIGSLADASAVAFTYPSVATTNEASLALTVTPDSAKSSVFLGSALADVAGDPNNDARLAKTLPADYTQSGVYYAVLPDESTIRNVNSYAPADQPTCLPESGYPAIVSNLHTHALTAVAEVPATELETGVKAHYRCTICGAAYQDSEGATEATSEWLTIPTLNCDHAAKEHVAEVAPTYTATGVAEHWYCPTCGTYFAADGVTETTAEALVLPFAACPHTNVEHHAEEPATFLATGVIEYWYCPDCLKYFSDSAFETETDADSLTEAIRVDANGLTDAQMVEMGALAKAVSPEGDVKAYSTVSAAYTEGAQWTAPGGVVTLLQDYSVFTDTYNAAGYFNNSVKTKETNQSWTYDNADANDPRFAGLDLKGFWFDLGGHTIVFRSGYAFFGTVSVPLNFRNGTIIYQNTAATAINYGMFKNGTTSVRMNSATEIYRPTYTFDNITILSAERATKAESGSAGNPQVVPIFPMAALQSQVNVIDSTIIAAGTGVFRYLKSVATDNGGPLDAFAAAHGYRHEINLRGNTVIGTTSTGTAGQDAVIYCASAGYGNSGEEADCFNVNVEGDNVVFLGNAIAAFGNATMGALANVPEDYVLASESYALKLPNKAAFVNETRVGEAVFGYQSKATSIPMWVKDTGFQAAAKITAGETEAYVASVTKAIKRAEILGRTEPSVTVTLLQDAAITESAAIGLEGTASAFTLDLNGKALTGEGLITVNGGAGTEIAMHVTGTLGGGATEAKFFAGLPALAYAGDNTYVVEKGRYFTNYSLNLEDSVSINLYTDGANGDPDSVGYVQDGKEYSLSKGELHDWVVDTLAAKQMSESVTVCAVKAEGTTTYIDFSTVSVKGYVDSDPAAGETDASIAAALNATLDTMMIYGKLAEKFFANDFTDLTADELTAIGVSSIPDTDVSNLTDADRVVTVMDDHTQNASAASGFWGTAAVLEDSICLKFYFFGAEFEGATASSGGEALTVGENGKFKFVQTAVAAKDFDAPITVDLTASDGTTALGSVTDSVSAYTSRIGSGEDTYKLAQALKAYGADAKRYAEAKAGA